MCFFLSRARDSPRNFNGNGRHENFQCHCELCSGTTSQHNIALMILQETFHIVVRAIAYFWVYLENFKSFILLLLLLLLLLLFIVFLYIYIHLFIASLREKKSHIFGFLFLFFFFFYAVTMLTFQIKKTISSEKWLNYVVTFFLKMLKIGVDRTMLNGEKKEDGLR